MVSCCPNIFFSTNSSDGHLTSCDSKPVVFFLTHHEVEVFHFDCYVPNCFTIA